MAKLIAGTSGFAYAAWKPGFYPEKLPAKKFLEHYAGRLNGVEINYTFRRLLTANVVSGWLDCTPDGFQFAIKAHMRITHIQRLKPAEFTDLFFRAVDPLRATRRLGPVLFQLPPQFRAEPDTLGAFLASLPEDIRCAFEFRHASWLTDAVYELLRRHNVALCLAESDKFETPPVLTADFVYARLRKSEYTAEGRQEIAGRVRALTEENRDAYIFFKHEETPAGALYAEELLSAVTRSRAAS